LNERDGIEEERRLFYVAVTRARRDLFLCHPVAVGFTGMDFASKSEFLEELSAHLVDDVAIEEDYASIDAFVVENNWTASIEPEYGIRYIVHRTGDQDVKAENGDDISVHYQGELFDGTIFDSSVGKSPLDFTLGSGSLIVGFEAGASQLHDKDSATILIPPVYGYGKNGSGNVIPGNTPLRFGLDVLNITKN